MKNWGTTGAKGACDGESPRVVVGMALAGYGVGSWRHMGIRAYGCVIIWSWVDQNIESYAWVQWSIGIPIN